MKGTKYKKKSEVVDKLLNDLSIEEVRDITYKFLIRLSLPEIKEIIKRAKTKSDIKLKDNLK